MALSERLARYCSCAALAAVALGPALCLAGLAAPMTGFGIFSLALLLGLVAAIAAVVALVGGRFGARRSLVLSLAAIALMAGAGGRGLGLPPINDISTDTDDPPAFAAAAELEANRGRDMSYPGEEFRQQQLEAYAGLGPLNSQWPPGEAVAKLEAALLAMPGTEIIDLDPASGRIEATATTRIFAFVDDVVVRVRAEGDGSRIDVRSKSRDGRGDLGANAARIESLLGRLR